MLVPDPLRNGCITRHLRWSLSLAEEHPLILGAVVARAQVVLGGVAVDLVVDEEVDLLLSPTEAAVLATLCDRTTCVDPWRDEQLGADGGVKNGTLD